MTAWISDGARIFCMLLKRDLIVLVRQIQDTVIDSAIWVSLRIFTYGYLLPVLGMPIARIADAVIGSIIFSLLLQAFTLSMKVSHDRTHKKFIDYHLTLPISKRWLFFEYITYFVIRILLISLPLFAASILLLGDRFVMIQSNFLNFGIMYTIAIAFIATFLLGLSFNYSFEWFRANIWPRFLTPLTMFSAVFVPWHLVYAYFPRIGMIFLLSPFTHITEGVRSTLIGPEQHIPLSMCLGMTSLFLVGAVALLRRGVLRSLDPV